MAWAPKFTTAGNDVKYGAPETVEKGKDEAKSFDGMYTWEFLDEKGLGGLAFYM